MKQSIYHRLFVKLLGSGVALLLLALGTECYGQVSSCVCGFITLHVKGTGNTNSSALSFLGLGLTRPMVFRGNLESFGPGTITDMQARWIDNQFNGTNGPHYLEITSGSHAGFLTDILDTDAASKTLTLDHDLESPAGTRPRSCGAIFERVMRPRPSSLERSRRRDGHQ